MLLNPLLPGNFPGIFFELKTVNGHAAFAGAGGEISAIESKGNAANHRRGRHAPFADAFIRVRIPKDRLALTAHGYEIISIRGKEHETHDTGMLFQLHHRSFARLSASQIPETNNLIKASGSQRLRVG